MRLLIKFFLLIGIVISITWFGFWLESYFHKVYPCNLKNVKFKGCISGESGHKDYFGNIHISVTGFCENYDLDSEEFFLQKVDSAVLSVAKTMDKKKYTYFSFSVLNDCPITCNEDKGFWPGSQIDPFNHEFLNELECEEKHILNGGFNLKNKGVYGFFNHKLKSKSKLSAGKLEDYKFTRKIDLDSIQ